MSLNTILNSAMSGLAAAQAGMNTSSNNIANVGTSGYARERVNQTPGSMSGLTNGVLVGDPQRIANAYLEAAVNLKAGDAGLAQVTATYMDQIEATLGGPSSSSTLPSTVDALISSAIAATGADVNAQASAVLVAQASTTFDGLRQISSDLTQLRADMSSDIAATVDQINGLLGKIADLNDTIAGATGQGRSAAKAQTDRTNALAQLGGLIGITARPQSDGRVTIDAEDGTVLLDRRLRQLSYAPGGGPSTPIYPIIDVRFADHNGAPGPATGDTIQSAAVGGRLGGLIELRNAVIPGISRDIDAASQAIAQALNTASNAATTVPPPNSLIGQATGLGGADRLGFTGKAVFAVTGTNGVLVAKTTVDFDALGTGASISDAVSAINAGLGGAATASFANGVLSIKAASTTNGVAVAQDPAAPSNRAGVGFSQFFGRNDVVRASAPLTPSGLTPADPVGMGAGESADILLRDGSGRILASQTLTPASGATFGDLLNQVNAGPIGAFGMVSMDQRGRFVFQPAPGSSGAALGMANDITNRNGAGASIGALTGLDLSGALSAAVRPEIAANPARLPMAQLNTAATVGQKAVGAGDTSAAGGYMDALSGAADIEGSSTTITQFVQATTARIAAKASAATDRQESASARFDDAVVRRDNFSGVNLDEELAQMVTLQNSYSAAARVISTVNQMYDTLINMMG